MKFITVEFLTFYYWLLVEKESIIYIIYLPALVCIEQVNEGLDKVKEF